MTILQTDRVRTDWNICYGGRNQILAREYVMCTKWRKTRRQSAVLAGPHIFVQHSWVITGIVTSISPQGYDITGFVIWILVHFTLLMYCVMSQNIVHIKCRVYKT